MSETKPGSMKAIKADSTAQQNPGVHASEAPGPQGHSLEERALKSMHLAVENLQRLQHSDGSWLGDYGGPAFLLPMYVALCEAAQRLPDPHRGQRMRAYILSTQRADGSIGLHAEDDRGSMFCTALNYVALRILGASPEEAPLVRMRAWMNAHGGPAGAASWGKFVLCLMGLYEWRGIWPILPELWLLPQWKSFHPSKLWCHCRQVYLPMAWLYGMRAQAPLKPLICALREELWNGAWETTAWEKQRSTVCEEDNFRPQTGFLLRANQAQALYEASHLTSLRKKAIEECLKHIIYENKATQDINIGPVNAILNAFVHLFREGGEADFERGFARLEEYLWEGHDGMKFQGYNSSQLWDTAFAIQSVLASPVADKATSLLEKAYGFVRDNQIVEDLPDKEAHYRHRCLGGWPFSTRPHGWPIADCTGEGLKCALALKGRFFPGVSPFLLNEAVETLLSFQNEDGGFATYELKRGGNWYEALNPSQVFGEIMVDHTYVECTSSCLQGLAHFQRCFGPQERIERALRRGAEFIQSQQRGDGSFEGSWAVCFSYGTWFSIVGLLAAGLRASEGCIQRAVSFLLSKQRSDGSWAEHFSSARERRWVEGNRGHVVQTSWALMSLVLGQCHNKAAMEKAARFLVESQEADGSWAREMMVGIFNKSCLISYDNYRHYFPLWALGLWAGREK
ncbi:MAG: terpene cyclase/mutase family protein [Cystobacterineae bacterium]|nr:terpene cyclase/mutase family protein [Cystobacterineae bacterium]